MPISAYCRRLRKARGRTNCRVIHQSGAWLTVEREASVASFKGKSYKNLEPSEDWREPIRRLLESSNPDVGNIHIGTELSGLPKRRRVCMFSRVQVDSRFVLSLA